MDKYIIYKNKYLDIKNLITHDNQLVGGKKKNKKIIKFSNLLYRVRYIHETSSPNFSNVLFFIDDPINIFWIWIFRIIQYSDFKTPNELKNLIVDIYEITIPLKLINFNKNNNNALQKYIKKREQKIENMTINKVS